MDLRTVRVPSFFCGKRCKRISGTFTFKRKSSAGALRVPMFSHIRDWFRVCRFCRNFEEKNWGWWLPKIRIIFLRLSSYSQFVCGFVGNTSGFCDSPCRAIYIYIQKSFNLEFLDKEFTINLIINCIFINNSQKMRSMPRPMKKWVGCNGEMKTLLVLYLGNERDDRLPRHTNFKIWGPQTTFKSN